MAPVPAEATPDDITRRTFAKSVIPHGARSSLRPVISHRTRLDSPIPRPTMPTGRSPSSSKTTRFRQRREKAWDSSAGAPGGAHRAIQNDSDPFEPGRGDSAPVGPGCQKRTWWRYRDAGSNFVAPTGPRRRAARCRERREGADLHARRLSQPRLPSARAHRAVGSASRRRDSRPSPAMLGPGAARRSRRSSRS